MDKPYLKFSDYHSDLKLTSPGNTEGNQMVYVGSRVQDAIYTSRSGVFLDIVDYSIESHYQTTLGSRIDRIIIGGKRLVYRYLEENLHMVKYWPLPTQVFFALMKMRIT